MIVLIKNPEFSFKKIRDFLLNISLLNLSLKFSDVLRRLNFIKNFTALIFKFQNIIPTFRSTTHY